MKLERRYSKQPITLETRDEGGANGSIGTIVAYISVFNSDSVDLGGFTEQVKPGAFKEALGKNDIVALVNHDDSDVVGRMSAGTLRLTEDEHGLRAEVDLPDTSFGRDLKVSAIRRDLIGCSFGFTTGGEQWSQRDGKDFCELTNIDLFEVSIGVTFPAYPETSMGMRNRLHERQEWERKRDIDRVKFLIDA